MAPDRDAASISDPAAASAAIGALDRVIVIGPIASGKTTLAARLATALGSPHVELDEMHWQTGFVARPTAEFLDLVRAALDANERWVICGNYIDDTQEMTWPLTEAVIWLDYPLRVRLTRNIRRRWQRSHEAGTATTSAPAGRSRLRGWLRGRALLSNAYLALHILRAQIEVIRNFRYWRRFFAAQIGDPRWSHGTMIRLRTPEAADQFIAAVESGRRGR